ncbi:hypothetical protein AAVH_34561 [Aphelenchoides avenae]|nr:hypothetical protein AAVH_34561 [Aphelenchus avenae]
MLLPSDNVLDVLHCVDFATLLALRRSGSAFYGVIYRNQSILPRLRVFDFCLNLATGDRHLQEIVENTRSMVLTSSAGVHFTDEFDYSLLHPFAEAVGTNFVNSATIASTLGPKLSSRFDMQKAVDALPALKHVRKLSLDLRCLMHTSTTVDTEAVERLILSPLDNLQRLELDNVANRTDWAFLRKEWALRLHSLSLKAFGFFEEAGAYGPFGTPVNVYPEIDASGQAEILEYCADFVHIQKGISKKLAIKGWRISPKFLKRIVKVSSQYIVIHHVDYNGNRLG